jgi:phytoene dehydrogenase-like protein
MVSCDVAVVGAGISGLTAASLLARAGLGVCVVEEQPRAGGYLQGFSRRGFTFDTAVQWLNGMGPEGLVGRIFGLVSSDYPRCKPLHRIRRYKSESFDYLLTSEPDQLRDGLCSDFPAEAAGLHRLFADCRKLGLFLRDIYRRMRALETMSVPGKAVLGLRMLSRYLPVRRSLRSELEKGLARYISDPKLARLFCAEEKLISVMAPIAWGYEKDFFAPPTGGCQTWVSWLAGQLEHAGAELLLGDAVDEVLLEGGRACGVRCASGRTIRSSWVLAACDVQRLYERMLPAGAVPARLRKKQEQADLYYSNVSVFLGLRCDPRGLGFGEELIQLTRDDISRAEHSSGEPHRTALTVLSPSVRDPTLAPPGKGTLTIHCPAWLEPHDRWKTGPDFDRGAPYREAKQEFAQVMLERVARALAPGLVAEVELMEVATPVTFWRYTANRQGSIMGASPTDRNIKSRLAHYLTPVDRLLLGGHWAEYGGGVPMAVKAAVNTSLLILQKTDRRAFAQLRDVMDGHTPA